MSTAISPVPAGRRTEAELNGLRQQLADMVHDAGGMICGYNVTVFPDTLGDVPAIVTWALDNVDRVQSYTLTMLRLVEADAGFAYFAGDRRVDVRETVYFSPIPYRRLTSSDIRAEIQKASRISACARFSAGPFGRTP